MILRKTSGIGQRVNRACPIACERGLPLTDTYLVAYQQRSETHVSLPCPRRGA